MNQSAHTVYQQCTRCVMDTTDPDISFDQQGYCNHCRDFLTHILPLTYRGASGDNALGNLLLKIKSAGKTKKYDVVLGISGGADSCYTAYCCKQLGLRVLLVHVDNGWDTATSVSNIEAVCRALSYDYVSCVLPWEDFKEVQRSHLFASVPEMESPTDIALLEELHKVAAEYGISYVFSGGNYVTEGILPKAWHYNAKDKKYARAIHRIHGRKPVTYFPSFSFADEFYYKFFKGIRLIYLLNYLPFKKQEAITILESIGWKKYGEKHHESFYTRVVQSYILPAKFNIDYRKATLSTKICTGQISRNEALHILGKATFKGDQIESDIDYVCKKLDLSKKNFEQIMRQKTLTHRDFPNNETLLNFLYRLYRFFV